MRGHGEGSITQRKDGRWQAQISIGGGERKTYYGKTKAEVREKLRVAINEQKAGTLILAPNQTLEVFLTCSGELYTNFVKQYHTVVSLHNKHKSLLAPTQRISQLRHPTVIFRRAPFTAPALS